jgi:hypothetical protein
MIIPIFLAYEKWMRDARGYSTRCIPTPYIRIQFDVV